jgi:hypothetical protein
MDGVGKDSGGLLVLGATNVPWELDPGKNYFKVTGQMHYIYICIHSVPSDIGFSWYLNAVAFILCVYFMWCRSWIFRSDAATIRKARVHCPA